MSKNIDFTDITAEEIFELVQAGEDEVKARQNRKALQTEINDVLLKARQNDAATTPAHEWNGTPHIDQSYALGETTVKDGVRYRSAIPNNRCIPGECQTGWVQASDPSEEDQ